MVQVSGYILRTKKGCVICDVDGARKETPTTLLRILTSTKPPISANPRTDVLTHHAWTRTYLHTGLGVRAISTGLGTRKAPNDTEVSEILVSKHTNTSV